jgi:hypothetical protein
MDEHQAPFSVIRREQLAQAQQAVDGLEYRLPLLDDVG